MFNATVYAIDVDMPEVQPVQPPCDDIKVPDGLLAELILGLDEDELEDMMPQRVPFSGHV